MHRDRHPPHRPPTPVDRPVPGRARTRHRTLGGRTPGRALMLDAFDRLPWPTEVDGIPVNRYATHGPILSLKGDDHVAGECSCSFDYMVNYPTISGDPYRWHPGDPVYTGRRLEVAHA